MVSKEPSHLLTGQTNSKSTLADKLPGTMTVRSVLLNRDSPDIESRLKKRRNRTHQVRFKDLEDGSSSSGNSGTGENNSNQRTATDGTSPHPVRKHGSRTPLPWGDEPHISSLPGQTSVVGAVRGDMASTIEVVAAFLARAPPHPLTPGPTRRCWTPPQANSLTLPMTRKPSTSTAIQTSPCLKKPLSTHTRSHSLGDSVGIDGDDEHDSQDENFFHNHVTAHRPKDLNGASGCSERTTIERRSKSRTELKSAVVVVKNSKHSGPPSVSHTEPCQCTSASVQTGPKRPGSSTPSLVRRRKRFSRTTSDPGKEVHYCTTPTQTESRSLSPPRLNTTLCTTQVQTESPSSFSETPKYSTTKIQTECPTHSSCLKHPTTKTSKKSSSCHTPTVSSIDPCTTQSQSKSACASQETSTNTMQIRSESLSSSLVKNRESLPNQTVPYHFTQNPPSLTTHTSQQSVNKASFSVETPTSSNSTKMLVSRTHPTATTYAVASVVTKQSEITDVTPYSVAPVATPHSVAPVVTSHSVTPVVTPHSLASVVTPHSVSPVATPHSITPVVTPHSVAPVVTPHSAAPVVTPHSIAPVVTPHSIAPIVTPLSVDPVPAVPDCVGPVLNPDSVVTTLSVCPSPADYVCPDVIAQSVTPVITTPHVPPVVTHSLTDAFTQHNSTPVVPVVTPHSAPPASLHSVTPVVTPDSVTSNAPPQSVTPVVTPQSKAYVDAPIAETSQSVTPHSVDSVVIPQSIASVVTSHSVAPVTPHSVVPVVTPHSVVPVVTPHSEASIGAPKSVASIVTSHSEAPVVTTHSEAHVVTPKSVASVVTSHSVAPVVAPQSIASVVPPHSEAHVLTPHPEALVVRPQSVTTVVTSHSEAPVVTPKSIASAPHSEAHVLTPHSEALFVRPQSVTTVLTPNSEAHVLTPQLEALVVRPHSVASVVTSHSEAPIAMPKYVPSAPHSEAHVLAPHSEALVVAAQSVVPVAPHPVACSGNAQSIATIDSPYSVVPVVTSHPVPNCPVVSPPAVILPVFSCSTSLSVIQDCPVSNIEPPTSLTYSAPSPVPKIAPVVPPNVTDITRHIATPVGVISLLPNATSPANVAPCTFVTQTAISCTSISYYTTTHPVGPTGPQAHVFPPAYATLVQTVSHCNIPCQVLKNTVRAKLTPFSSPVPKLKSCTSQPILVKTYTSNLPIMQQCVTPTKTAPLYSSTFRAAPPYTPPFQTQVKRGLRLPPPPPPPPPYTPRKSDQPATQTSALRTDTKATEKDKDGKKDNKEDDKCKDLSGRVSSLKHRAQTPPVALMKERGSPAKACFKSSCLSSAHAQLGVLHKMLCSGARPRPNTPCQFPLPQSQQGCSRVRRCSVPTERSTAGPLTPAQADTLRQVQEILGGLMSGAKCKLDPAKVTEKLLSPNGPLRDIRSLQTQLQSLEGVLETSQNTIKVLLDVIQDLEKKEAVRDGHLYRTGQDIENCGTCRDCACIIYSVEHDFRLQEGQVVRTWKVGDPPEERPQTPTPPPSTPHQQDSPQAVRPPVSAKKNRKKCFWFL